MWIVIGIEIIALAWCVWIVAPAIREDINELTASRDSRE